MNTEKKNSLNYIKSITQSKKGFSVPENYFTSVEDAVLANLKTKDLPKQSAFKIPKNYFENFESDLFAKIDFPKKEVKVISLKTRLLQAIPMAAAASILLFIGLNYFSLSKTVSFDSISTKDMEIWIDQNYLETIPASVNFTDADFKDSNLLEEDTSINDDDILEYLNTIDNSTLITEIES